MVTWLCREATLPRRYGMSVIEQGKIGPSGPARGGDAPPPQQTFSFFSPPPEIPVSCPRTQARLSHHPASLPVSPVRGDARVRFAARPGTTPLFEPSRLPPPR